MTRQHKVSPYVVALMVALFSIVVLLGVSGTAHALSVTLDGCPSCFGNVYTLDVTVDSFGVGTTTYDVAYTVNTSGYTGGGSGLDAIAYKIATEGNIVSATWDGSPTATFSDPLVFGSLSATGCNGMAGAGFICTESSNIGGVTVPDGTYTFAHDVTLNNGTLFASSDWSIKALYVNGDGGSAGLTSAKVPVPGTLLLFGLGFALMVGWQHRAGRGMRALPS